MKKRLGLAAALIGKPKFLMLDEPFVDLDQLGITQLQNISRAMITQRTTVLLSSHQLAELGPLVNRTIFLNEGRVTHDLQQLFMGAIV